MPLSSALEVAPALVVSDSGRSETYASHLRDMAERGLCPLDVEVFRQIGGERILHETGTDGDGWILAQNLEPYPNTAKHLIFFPKRHIVSPAEMTESDRLVVWDLLSYSCDELEVAYGGIFMRFSTNGMHAAAGASVVHLHGQIVVPNINPETGRAPGWEPGRPTPDEHAVVVKIG